MGTRHLIAIYHEGRYALGQYGQWDGYPSGQGVSLLDALRKPGLMGKVKANLSRLYVPTPAQIAVMDAELRASGKSLAQFTPSMSRDTSSDIMEIIAGLDGDERLPVRNGIGFAGNSLFCEWAYVIDFDKRTFEVFKGFNHDPLPEGERFADPALTLEKSDGYYPVRHVVTFSLDDLPGDDTFMSHCEPPDEDSEEQAAA